MDESHLHEHFDVIIIGGGAAGLSAALMLGRARRRVLVVDEGRPRNRFATHMHGVLGHEGVDPAELVRQGREEVGAYDVVIRTGAVAEVEATDHGLQVILSDSARIPTRALVVASGLTDELPDIDGLAERWGDGVAHCPYCHGWEVRDQRLGVLGTSPLSLHQAELLRQWSDRLVFFTAGCGELDPAVASRLRSRDVRLIDTPVTGIRTEGDRLTGVRLADGEHIDLDAVFTAPTPRPHDEFVAGLGLERTETPVGSFLAVDPTGQTSHPRIWAIGNVVNPGANVPMSIGAGAMAGGVVNMALVSEEFDDAVISPADHWEEQYASRQIRWSGRANPTMADVVRGLPAGSVLELGCGEGGDAVWLAEQGWRVTAVDISPTAVARAAAGARERDVADRITWIARDLSTWTTDLAFDLVTASFFHSEVELRRTEVLRRAAETVRPGGHLLIVSHVFETAVDIPPWASGNHANGHHAHGHQEHTLLTPPEEIAELALDPARWDTVRQEIRSREATSPDGEQTATVKDGVVLLRRRH